MSRRLLFLLGGPIFEATAEKFVPAACSKNACIVLLLFNSFKKEYLPEYIQPWEKRGVSKYHIIYPEKDGTMDVSATSEKIREATGIFIGGGPTDEYQKLYATEPIKTLLCEKYRQGVAIAGLSAGAMIVPEMCAYGLGEKEDLPIQILTGLGLLKNCIIGPHFTERQVLPKMLHAMAQTKITSGWGINETACAVFKNEEFAGIIGKEVYEITITTFETKDHRVTEKITVFKSN
jgi:cyanophycinase